MDNFILFVVGTAIYLHNAHSFLSGKTKTKQHKQQQNLMFLKAATDSCKHLHYLASLAARWPYDIVGPIEKENRL